MRLAYVFAHEPGDTAAAFFVLAERLQARGMRCIGTVEEAPERYRARHPCDMALRVLPDGPTRPISQKLGAGARGCRLDPGALEACVSDTAARLSSGADLLILNKFGKLEEQGRGFRDVMAEALSLGIPVLAGVNALSHASFLEFSGGLATELAADPDILVAWAEPQLAATG
ncbi:DUF2478 domain-containing protein [Afifella pfennigii]|uniref:DUF2478 domain-containing protein n=1 Tax=Afifella pfennigii TaxID=209897 RepID=UPI00055910C0|nr:DUF2478 domain-containing protein [Afifella pfennigii]